MVRIGKQQLDAEVQIMGNSNDSLVLIKDQIINIKHCTGTNQNENSIVIH